MPVPAERMTDIPEWFDGKKINEVLFCQSFLETHPMKCIQGRFFTVDGLLDDEESLKMEIYDRIKDYTCCGIAKKATQLLDALRLACYSPPLPIERKGQQSIQRPLYVRFLCFGNGSLSALYDRSYGFYRRQIILTTKERNPNRRDDRFLAEKLKEESEGIFLWCLAGLQRLIQNNYEFTISDAAKSNLEEAISDSNNIPRFLESDGYFRFKADGQITSKELYALYELWCDENSGKAVSPKSFGNYMCQNEKQLNLERSNNVHNRDGRRVWGFWGMEPVVKLYV